MNKKTDQKNRSKKSDVIRLDFDDKLFYKNLSPNKKNARRGAKEGRKILEKFLARSNGDKFSKFILKELDETNDLLRVKYGDRVDDFFFPICRFYQSFLENNGEPNMNILKTFVEAMEQKEGDGS